MARPKVYSPQLRGRLIGAATTTLVTGGPDALSLRVIAAQAGTSTNAIYTLFGSRDDLLQAAIADATASMVQEMTTAAGEGRSLAELLSLSTAYLTWARQNPVLYRLIYTAQPPHAVGRGEDARFPLLCLVRTLVNQGVFRDEDPENIAHSLHAAAHGLAGLEMHDVPQLQELFTATVRGWLTQPSSLP